MGIFRPDRSRRPGEDPFLLWKVRAFVVGGAMGVAGMVMGLSPLVWGAVVVLALGVAIRFVDRRATEGREEPEAGD